MLVVDASAIAEFLLGTERGIAVSQAIENRVLLAPGHLPAELLSVLRGWNRSGHLSEGEALLALQEFSELGMELLDAKPLLPLAWDLRHNLSAYDALYVAAARAVGAKVLTLDARLRRAAPELTLGL